MTPEHTFQKYLVVWVQQAVMGDRNVFLCFDRSKPAGQWTHAHEKARGILAGTPDTLLICPGHRHLWCELKVPPNKLTTTQIQVGERLMKAGDAWFSATSVYEYFRYLAICAFPLHANASVLAELKDAAIASELAKTRLKKTGGKARARAATWQQIARARKAGVLV
jgi:hypothetical protein